MVSELAINGIPTSNITAPASLYYLPCLYVRPNLSLNLFAHPVLACS